MKNEVIISSTEEIQELKQGFLQGVIVNLFGKSYKVVEAGVDVYIGGGTVTYYLEEVVAT